ncbi:MAG: tRNA threonylcarbamoyladenosine dehydratase [Prevotella sp.]|jgi:tRNA A37 threonylcarbamoyladenosine dehydratase
MENQFSRTQLLLGKPALNTLADSRVAVFGVGGVGGYVVEVLARSGVGHIDIIDKDKVDPTNINRQIYALHSTVGRYKVDVAAERIHDINPACVVEKYKMFYLPQNADEIDLTKYDYVADCVDTVTAKLELIRQCHTLNVPLISSMGAANKLDPTGFRVTDISKTKMDPLAKILRKKMRKMNIYHLKVVYSEEPPLIPINTADAPEATPGNTTEQSNSSAGSHRPVPASNAFVPAAAGLIIGGEIVKDILKAAGTMRSPETPGT